MALTYSNGGPANQNQQVLNQAAGASSQNQSATGSESTSSAKTSTTSGTQAQSSAVNIANMDAKSLAVLQALVAQLSDRPAVSREEAAMILAKQGIQAPKLQLPPSSVAADAFGRPMEPLLNQDFAKLNAEYEARINEVMKSGGIIAGGTKETNLQRQQILAEQQTLQKAREGYDKESAFADASMLQARAMREMLEKILPSINNAIEASGTSGGATAGLLKTDAAARSAESAAALGLDAAIKYGGIFDEQSKMIGALIESQPAALSALLNALGIAKGAVQQGGTSNVTSNKQTVSEVGQATGDKATSTNTSTADRKTALLTPQSSSATKGAGYFDNYSF